jgi:hypothetical protein
VQHGSAAISKAKSSSSVDDIFLLKSTGDGKREIELIGKAFNIDHGALDAVSWLSRLLKCEKICIRSKHSLCPLFVQLSDGSIALKRTTSAGKFAQFDE